jgi:hypothetical protein
MYKLDLRAPERDIAVPGTVSCAWAPALIGAAALLLFPADASARALGGTHTRADIKAHCKAAGGDMTNYKGGGYGCNVLQGGTVNCNKNGKCQGTDPPRLNPNAPKGHGSVGQGGPHPLAQDERGASLRPMGGGSVQRFGGGGGRHH